METIIVENAKYRIVKFTAGEGSKVLCNDFWVRGMRCRFRLGDATARLEKKVDTFFFWSIWKRVEFTNVANVVEEWMHLYFTGVRLLNEPNKRVTIGEVEYEISSFDGGQRYFVEEDGSRGNPAHTPERGRECGCSGCDWR